MIFPEAMKQVIAVVLESDAEKVTRELLRLGILHFVRVAALVENRGTGLGTVEQRISEARISETRKRIENIFRLGSSAVIPNLPLDASALQPVDLPAVEEELDALSAGLDAFRERQRLIQQESDKLRDMRRHLELMGGAAQAARVKGEYSFLSVEYGSVPEERAETLVSGLERLASVTIETGAEGGKRSFLLVTLKRDAAAVKEVKDRSGWSDTEIPDVPSSSEDGVLRDIEDKLLRLHEEQASIARQAEKTIDGSRNRLEELWANLRMNELYVRIQSFFNRTARTILFSGWLPASSRDELEKSIREITGGTYYLEWHDPPVREETGSDDVPVKLNNPPFLGPFQMLVQNYATPAYGTIDPTPFVAVAYLCMFGLMFGDAGHGLVLLLGGLAAQWVRVSKRGAPMPILSLIAYCGGASILSGILFGSYFGQPLIPPLWFDYHGIVTGHVHEGIVSNVYDILAITIWFGIAVIGLGLLLNWANLISRRKWVELVFDKGGLLGGWIYAAGTYFAFGFVASGYKILPDAMVLFITLGIPVIALFFKTPLLHRREHGRHGSSSSPFFTAVDFFMEWIVEILEVFSGYLANTLSFMRVAGLGIAHVSLMTAFASISVTVSGGGSIWPWGILVLIAGNVLVIALEGLSAGIQALRLNYYEFFSKYFSGTGMAYAPVSLRSRN